MISSLFKFQKTHYTPGVSEQSFFAGEIRRRDGISVTNSLLAWNNASMNFHAVNELVSNERIE